MLYKSKYFVYNFLIVLLLFTNYTLAQFGSRTSDEKIAEVQVDNLLITRFGENSYEVNDIISIDQKKGDYQYYLEPLEDPYGTLVSCYIFTTRIAGTGENVIDDISDNDSDNYGANMIGVYKNDEILWLSKAELPAADRGILLLTRDINNDGNVEIITQWEYARYGAKLWIYSWDGSNGWRINAFEDPDEEYLGSIIDGMPLAWGYFDYEGDGIWEIYNKHEDFYETFSWNGSKYGKWQNTPQYAGTEWLPRNNLEVKVNCSVKKESNNYVYSYDVENLPTSKQRINTIYVQVKTDSFTTQVPNSDWKRRLHYLYNLDGWTIKEYGGKGYIEPGDYTNGFIKQSTALPVIGKYFIRAENTLPNISSMNDEEYESGDKPDITNNSVIGNTIGLTAPPNPFVPIDFIDTLKIYTDSSYSLGWITNEQTKDKYNNYFVNAKSYLNQNNNNAAKTELQKVITDCNTDSSSVLTSEAYALLYFNTDYLINRIPEGEPGLPVKLQDSQGNLLQGGSLQYYDGGWKDATDNGDGTFTVQTERTTVSLKMHYAGGSQQKDNVTVGADTVVFQTSDVTVKLLSSQNTLLDSGFVQYYASGWQDFGTLVNGTVHKELLSKNYTFKVKYAGSDKNKVQNLDTNTTVTFHTVNTEVQLQDSQGNLLPVPSGDGGEAEYYASGWKTFGELTNGKANKELLSRKYTFKVKYAGAENNLVQDLDSSTTVIFHTVNTTVQLKDSQGNLLDGGFAQYYAGGWQDFGAAINGVATKELLPKSYNFKMKFGGTDKDIVQDITNNSTVTFQTVNAEIQLRDSQGNLLDGGFAKYYASGWKDFGAAANGIAHKELLSRAYTFKIQYGGADMNHVQNLDTNTTVVFNTINVTVQLKDSQGNLLDSGEVEYYASGWKTFGSVVNGTVTKELLPRNYTFKMIHGGLNTTKDQDVSVNSTVNFATILTTVRVKDNQGQVIENAEALYYGSGWKQIGFTNANGEVSKELLGRTITFKAKKDSKEKNKQQDTSTNSVVEIILE